MAEKARDLLDELEDALASVGTDKLRVSVVDTLPESPFNLTKISGTTLTGRDWSSDFTYLPNLNVDLQSVRRTIQSVMPTSGKDAAFPPDDYNHWSDVTVRTVTETSYTEKTRCWVRPRNLPTRSYGLFIYLVGYIDTAGQTLYVRFRSHYRGTLAEFTFTETAYTTKSKRATYLTQIWWDDPIYVEAYVTAGTGYIKDVLISFVKCNVVEGWTGTIGEGEQFTPMRVDADGYLQAKCVPP